MSTGCWAHRRGRIKINADMSPRSHLAPGVQAVKKILTTRSKTQKTRIAGTPATWCTSTGTLDHSCRDVAHRRLDRAGPRAAGGPERRRHLPRWPHRAAKGRWRVRDGSIGPTTSMRMRSSRRTSSNRPVEADVRPRICRNPQEGCVENKAVRHFPRRLCAGGHAGGKHRGGMDRGHARKRLWGSIKVKDSVR